ncbi:MAG: endonuclease/exonuclease/phosphatase family protein [Isosphaeraceae bacterium]
MMTLDRVNSLGRSSLKRLILGVLAWGLSLVLAMGMIGQLTQDRSVMLGLLMYLPTAPLGVVAIAFDLSRRGGALGPGRVRYGLAWVGLTGAFVASLPLVTLGGGSPRPGEIGLLQWNVMWGGGPFRDESTWNAQCSALRASGASVLVLSEAPERSWLDRLDVALGPGWRGAEVEGDSGWPHWFHVAVYARGPVVLERRLSLPNGSAGVFLVRPHGRELRLLVVDGVSDPLLPRTPFLKAVADLCQKAKAEGRPFDAVLGDFNAPARCLGFAFLADAGYQLASRAGGPGPQWRGTFPALLPVLDIDHVWISPRWEARSCRLFHAPWSDHRAQVVRFSEKTRSRPSLANRPIDMR